MITDYRNNFKESCYYFFFQPSGSELVYTKCYNKKK